MALRAGIGGAQRDRQIGSRHAKAVIAPDVDNHVSLGRHVAIDALCPSGTGLMMVVLGGVEFCRHVTLGT